MKNKSLGDRMKDYERVSKGLLTPRSPVIVRVDGKAFHTYTKGFDRPFDSRIITSMVESAIEVAKQIQGFKMAYIQSDEASFVFTDYDDINTQGWFSYELQKIVSISASVMTAHFNRIMDDTLQDLFNKKQSEYNMDGSSNKTINEELDKIKKLSKKIALFDSRAFVIPRDEIANYFLWRAQDWARNSVQMYARANFSHKQCNNKKIPDLHELLYSIGKNWAKDLSDTEKNGTFLIREEGKIVERTNVLPNYSEVSGLLELSLNKEEEKVRDGH